MIPKLKAEELFDKMLYNDGDKYHHCSHYVGKNCALIAVDEIIKEINDNYDTLHSADRKQYWKGIKKEIKNL
jgi:hypothetical protein